MFVNTSSNFVSGVMFVVLSLNAISAKLFLSGSNSSVKKLVFACSKIDFVDSPCLIKSNSFCKLVLASINTLAHAGVSSVSEVVCVFFWWLSPKSLLFQQVHFSLSF